MNDRLKRTADPGRMDRAMEDRDVTERIELSDEDRIALFQQSFHQSVLPDLPRIPGYHVCWLTTTHPSDTIQTRMRMGYEPIAAKDVPGFENSGMKSGEFAGFISVNEMLACKIREDLYRKFVQIAHHDMPRNEEQRMADTADMIRNRLQSERGDAEDGVGVFEGDGYEALRKAPPRPRFE